MRLTMLSERRIRQTVPLLLAIVVAVGCRRESTLSGSRTARYGATALVSAYKKDPVTKADVVLVHVLFEPAFETPQGGFGGGTSSGGTAKQRTITYSYEEDSGRSVKATPVTILDDTIVEAAGRRFYLVHGNTFIARVALNGSVALTQLPLQLESKSQSADSVMDAIRQTRGR